MTLILEGVVGALLIVSEMLPLVTRQKINGFLDVCLKGLTGAGVLPRSVIYGAEEITQRDIDNDNVIGRPEKEAPQP